MLEIRNLTRRFGARTAVDGVSLSIPDGQMPTSLAPSSAPPNHAATSPPDVSAIVDAWHSGVGDFS